MTKVRSRLVRIVSKTWIELSTLPWGGLYISPTKIGLLFGQCTVHHCDSMTLLQVFKCLYSESGNVSDV